MDTAIQHPVPDRVKPSFVIFDIRALWRSALSVRVSKITNDGLTRSGTWFPSCTHMATVGVKGLIASSTSRPIAPALISTGHVLLRLAPVIFHRLQPNLIGSIMCALMEVATPHEFTANHSLSVSWRQQFMHCRKPSEIEALPSNSKLQYFHSEKLQTKTLKIFSKLFDIPLC